MSAATARFALSRSELRTGVRTSIQRGGWSHPDVLLVEDSRGRMVVVKDFAPRPAWVRWTLGRIVSRREARIYQVLEDHPAVPRLLGRVDALAFAVEYRPGVPASRSHAERFTAAFAAQLESAIRQLHARGVVHLDLAHRSNLLADEDGRPVLIDFGAALHLRPGGRLGRLLLPALASIDLRALSKWRRRFASYPRPAVPPSSTGSTGSPASTAVGGTSSEGGRGASRPM